MVEIKKSSWPEQPLFPLLRTLGRLNDKEMYSTFNMGVGLVMIADESFGHMARAALKEFPQFVLYEIGQVLKGEKRVTLCE
jgi:phosphoribosylformylglycinamidine cyclo-ligase